MSGNNSSSPRTAPAVDHTVPSAQSGNASSLTEPGSVPTLVSDDLGSIITVVRDVKNPLGKRFKLNPDGTVSKTSSVHVSCGMAVMHRIETHEELASLLKNVGDDSHAAIINAAFAGIEVGEQFVILSERQIEQRLGIPRSDRDRQKGIHDIMLDGKPRKAIGRFKENVRPSRWQIIDRDIDRHTPAEYAEMSDPEWLQKMDKIMPGLEMVSHVRTASTSSRVLRNGQPVGAGNGHVWIKLTNPLDIERARTALIVQAAAAGMTWLKPRHSRSEPGKVVGKSLTTICDPSVWTPGRLIFIGKPVVDEGLTVAPPSAVVHHGEGDTLDTASIVLPDADTVRRITRTAGIEMDVQTGGSGLRVTAHDLTLDTELDTEDHGQMTVRQLIAKGITGKVRCQTPFRDSKSFAAFLSFGADGKPFIHDVGTGTTHWLNDFEANDFRQGKASCVHAGSGACAETPDRTTAQALIVLRQNDAAENQGVSAASTEEFSQPIPDTGVPETSAATTPAQDDEVIARLAAMKPLEYDRVRADYAKRMGCRPATLDKLVHAARNTDNESSNLPFPEVDPWPDPVDPAQLLDELSVTIHRFIVMDDEQADAVALWVVLTWFIEVVKVAPLIIANAPEKACAKSLLLELIGRISAKPLSVSNLSTAALFRSVEMFGLTLLIDEADTFIRANDDLKGLINAGHTRAHAFVLRLVGDNHEPKRFSVWGAKALAGIAMEKHLPDSTMSRAIVINLRRKLPHETVERLRHADTELFEGIASKLARFADDYASQVRWARPTLPDELSDRAQDNWEPLLAIAECAGPEWVRRATAAALKLSDDASQAVSTGNELLADIRQAFESKQVEKIRTTELIDALAADDEQGWATYNRGKPITPRQLAKLLAGYGIRPKTVRFGSHTPKGYERSQFADAFARYLTEVAQRRNDGPEASAGEVGGVADGDSVAATSTGDETPEPMTELGCGGVADPLADDDGASSGRRPPSIGPEELL